MLLGDVQQDFQAVRARFLQYAITHIQLRGTLSQDIDERAAELSGEPGSHAVSETVPGAGVRMEALAD